MLILTDVHVPIRTRSCRILKKYIVMHGAENNELYSMGGRTRILHNNFTAR